MTTVIDAPASPGRTDWSAGSGRSEDPRPHRRQISWLVRHDGVLAILVYLAASMFFYRSVVAHPVANCACGITQDPGDNSDFVWWFQWFVQALGHGGSLFHPTVIWTPTGINMAGTTASLLLALLAAPITLLWGPIVAYNVVMVLAPAVSGWGANRLCREITGARWPSLLAGATYGFSTYEIAHLVGHLQMVVVVCPPLAALCVIRLFKGTVSRRRFVIQLSLILIAQVFLSVEVMFTMTIVGLLALGAAWATGVLPRTRETARKLGQIAIAFAIAALATSWYALRVLGVPSYAAGAASLYPTDALSFFIPMPYTWLGGARLYGISGLFPGGWNETNAYLGLPLILIVGRYLVTRWRAGTTQMLAILLGAITIWILGPTLYVAGRRTLVLPYVLISRLPLFTDTMSGRVAVYLALVAAVVLAMWLTNARAHRTTAWCCGVLALVAVLPNIASPSEHNVGAWTNPKFFSTTLYKHYLKPGESVLPILWGPAGESFMWQAEDHMYWNMADGYWVFQPIAGWKGPVTEDLWTNYPRAGDGPLLKQLIIKRRVSDVVLQNTATGLYNPSGWRLVLSRAGLRPTANVGGVTVYHVPSSWWAEKTSA